MMTHARDENGKFVYAGGKISVVCAYCECVFYLYPSDVKRGRRFCDHKCAMRWLSESQRGKNHHKYEPYCHELKVLTCLMCGKAFEVTLKEAEYRLYCGHGCANKRRITPSRPQKELFEIIKVKYPEAIMEYVVGRRIVDIAIPSLKLAIEYDGSYWHEDKNKDIQRDWELLGQGWITIRFNEDNIDTVEEVI